MQWNLVLRQGIVGKTSSCTRLTWYRGYEQFVINVDKSCNIALCERRGWPTVHDLADESTLQLGFLQKIPVGSLTQEDAP